MVECVRELEPKAIAGELSPSDRDRYIQGVLAIGMGSSAGALAVARAAVAATTPDEDRTTALGRQRNLGRVLLERQRAEEAIPLFDRILDNRRAFELPGVAEALIDAAAARGRLGRADEAVAILAQLDGAQLSAADRARCAEVAGMAWRVAGDASKARPYLEQAIEIRETLAPTHPDTALAYAEMAELLTLEGRLVEAEASYRHAGRLLLESGGPDLPHLARAGGRIAGLARNNGDLTGSLALHERALAIAMDRLGPDSPETISRLNDLANTRLAEGDFKAARGLFQLALAQSTSMAEPERSMFEATLHYNLAEVATEEWVLELALAEIKQAVERWTWALGPDHPFVALALESMATIRERGGDPAAAEELLERSLAIRRKRLGESHPRTAVAATQLGEVARRRGDLPTAANAIALALAGGRRAAGLGDQDLARIDTLSAWVTLARGGPSTEVARQAIAADEAGRAAVRQAVRYLSEADGLRVAAVRPRGLDLALSLVAEGKLAAADTRAVYDAVIRSRALVLDTIGARERETRGSLEHGELRRRLDDASRRLANLVYRGPGNSLDTFTQAVSEADAARDRAERELALASADYRREAATEEAGFADVAAALPRDASLLALVRYEHTTSSNPTATPELRYLAFVTRRGATAPKAVALGSAATLDAAIERWRVAVRDVPAARLDGKAAEVAYRRAAGELERLFWRPLAPRLAKRRVLVVADGLTQIVSFASLPVGVRYLIDTGPEFHSLTTERQLLRMPARALSSSSLLAVGAPAYWASPAEVLAAVRAGDAGDAASTLASAQVASPRQAPPASTAMRGGRDACGVAVTLTFQNLPESGLEVQEVAALWRRSDPVAPLLLTGVDASATRFAALARGRRLVHVATHGFYLADTCGPPLADGSGESRQNPMLLAGLAFAGANQRQGDGGDDDGILTAEEIARLDLGDVEWVVLSACDTGRGEIHDGEGVLGLRHAFEIAGARSVLTSLWPVDDASTRRFMAALYRARLIEHADTVSSVATAGRAVVEELRRTGSAHPALWASFVATGDWR